MSIFSVRYATLYVKFTVNKERHIVGLYVEIFYQFIRQNLS